MKQSTFDLRSCRSQQRFLVATLVFTCLLKISAGQILRNEQPCLAEGGICVVPSSCPDEGKFNRTGLCPEQEANGEAICCSMLPANVRTCQQHGGRCGGPEACRNVGDFGQLDCEGGKRCCLLIY